MPDECEWSAYHLFYADRKRALDHFVRPVISSLLAGGYIGRFFFIRYPLGGAHIRLRVCSRSQDTEIVEERLHKAAALFLSQYPSATMIDSPGDSQIKSRFSSGDLPAADTGLAYPEGTFLRFAFEPETERYGGAALLGHSLDFFFASSIRALGFTAAHGGKPLSRQLVLAMSLLAQQAWGFAESESEFLDLITYRTAVWQHRSESLCARGDQIFEENRDRFRALLLHELVEISTDSSPTAISPHSSGLYAAAACGLSQRIRSASYETRRQIVTSQMHMTANRLGLSNHDEIYINRILWRAAQDLATVEALKWGELLEFLAERRNSCTLTALEDLLPAFESELRPADNRVRPIGLQPEGSDEMCGAESD